jgi:hypothetical protein
MDPVPTSTDRFDIDANEELRVRAWRAERLRSLGLSPMLADLFADLVDWHAIARLVERGCPPHVAVEIVR